LLLAMIVGTLLEGVRFVKPILIKIEKHSDKFIAYPVGVPGLGMFIKGDAYEEVLSDVKSAVASFIEACSPEVAGSEVFDFEVLDVELPE